MFQVCFSNNSQKHWSPFLHRLLIHSFIHSGSWLLFQDRREKPWTCPLSIHYLSKAKFGKKKLIIGIIYLTFNNVKLTVWFDQILLTT